MRRPATPILKPLDTIECRDAILAPDGTEPDWPEADVIIGNPPFLGAWRLIAYLGEDRVSRMSSVYSGRVSGAADLVCYWFEKAGRQIALRKARRAGLVATNSIRGGANRKTLQAATATRPIFEAWSDEPWVIDGAAVRVSLICFGASDEPCISTVRLDGQPADEVYTDLTARRSGVGVDLTAVRRIDKNRGVAFRGDEKGGAFDIGGDQAREWLALPANPNGRTNADVLMPWVNGRGLDPKAGGEVDHRFRVDDVGSRRCVVRGALPVDPGSRLSDLHGHAARKAKQASPSALVASRSAIPRDAPSTRDRTALHRHSPRRETPAVRLARRSAYALTPQWSPLLVTTPRPSGSCTAASTRSGRYDSALGSARGMTLATPPPPPSRRSHSPPGLTPDIPAAEYSNDPRAMAIAGKVRRLVELRDRWLNPVEWVEWADEPVPGYPKRPVARDGDAARALKKRTLTNLYNARPQWLADAHNALDAAVAAAYGWPSNIDDEDVLGELLAMNRGER